MPRGQLSEVGQRKISANGYDYTKTADQGWRLTHHIIAEQTLGRPIREDETVRFKGSKRDLRPENIEVIRKGKTSVRRRLAQVEARIAELEAERDELRRQL